MHIDLDIALLIKTSIVVKLCFPLMKNLHYIKIAADAQVGKYFIKINREHS